MTETDPPAKPRRQDYDTTAEYVSALTLYARWFPEPGEAEDPATARRGKPPAEDRR